jgi:hypothetical protein
MTGLWDSVCRPDLTGYVGSGRMKLPAHREATIVPLPFGMLGQCRQCLDSGADARSRLGIPGLQSGARLWLHLY